MTNEQLRQEKNRALAARLVGVLSFEVGYGELAATRDYVWDSFIDFYTRLDKHNCPKQNDVATFKETYGAMPMPPAWKSPGYTLTDLLQLPPKGGK